MAVYTLFGQPASPATLQADAANYEMGVQFAVSQPGTITGIWFFSAPGAARLPNEIDIYGVPGGGLGVSNTTPSWSGAAGSGWVKATFATPPVVLPGYKYKACVLTGTGSGNWYSATSHYWDTGAGANGITNGPLSAPNNAGGDHGQDTFVATSTTAYPNTSLNATNYWVDVEVTADPTQPTGTISGGPWTQVFADEFNAGNQPNWAVWADHDIFGDIFRCENGGTEVQWSPHNHRGESLANSILTLTARHESPYALDPLAPNPLPGGQVGTYTSGRVQSHPGFNFTYGYVEALIQIPPSSVAGAWPAFWMDTSDAVWPPEIDIFEFTTPTWVYHHPDQTTETGSYPGAPTDYTNWHVLGMRWTPTAITYFLDGAQIGQATAQITTFAMHVIFDLAVTTAATGAGYPATMNIDYVRAWVVTGCPAQPVITSISPASGVPSAGSITVNFGSVSGATSYRATACPVDANADGIPFSTSGTRHTASGSSSPLTITGLPNGGRWTVSVAAINATGYSIESALVPSLAPSSGGLLLAAFP